MKTTRRTFIKTAAVAASAVGAPGALLAASATDAVAQGSGAGDMPKGMTFLTIKRGTAMSLGIKTDRGILDVKKAEAALKTGAPTTIDDVFKRGGGAQLKRLVERASAQSGRGGFFVAEDTLQFGPCVTNPEKIMCVGLNYRKHAAETGNPVPPVPILFNKYNSALNGHRGVIHVSKEAAEKFDYEIELRLRLLHWQRFHRARSAVTHEPVDAGQEQRRLRADRPVSRHRRSRRRPE